jgi:hypothetical protein
MVRLVLDSEGRLLEFHALPMTDVPDTRRGLEADWSLLLRAAGLDPEHVERDRQVSPIPTINDAQAAWVASWSDLSNEPLRVQAAAYERRPVFFRVTGPWTQPERPPDGFLMGFPFPMFLLFGIVLPVGAGILAWRNNRLGRGDRRGAFKLAAFALIWTLMRDLLGSTHVPEMAEVPRLISASRDAIVAGMVFWVLYMAFEPQVRKQAPRMLVSWSRVLFGRFSDPLVGRDLLVGLALGSLGMCVIQVAPVPFHVALAPQLVPSTAATLSLWFWSGFITVGAALSYAFVASLLLRLFKQRWLALVVFLVALTTVVLSGGSIESLVAVGRAVVLLGLVWYTLTTFGLLATVAVIYVRQVLVAFPLTLDGSAWYAGTTIFAIGTVILPAMYACYLSVKERPQALFAEAQ